MFTETEKELEKPIETSIALQIVREAFEDVKGGKRVRVLASRFSKDQVYSLVSRYQGEGADVTHQDLSDALLKVCGVTKSGVVSLRANRRQWRDVDMPLEHFLQKDPSALRTTSYSISTAHDANVLLEYKRKNIGHETGEVWAFTRRSKDSIFSKSMALAMGTMMHIGRNLKHG